MTSIEHVNLQRYLDSLRDNPDIAEENKQEIIAFVDSLASEGIGESQQRKYVYNLKTILERFAPDGFQLADGDEQDLRKIMAGVHRSDYSDNVKRYFGVALKRYYRFKNGGEYPDMVDFISTTQSKQTNVTREDLFTEQEMKKLFSAFTNIRDIAFFKTLYESAARPGELHDCTIADIEFNERGDFIHLEGSKGTPDRTNQLIEAGQSIRAWLKSHPAGGDNPHEPRDASAPLWVKTEQEGCKKCGINVQYHNTEGCDRYQPKEMEKVKYSALYRSFKRACKKADIGSHRPYDFRHTRITEVSQFMSHEQLCKFSGWVPGSDRAKVYVHLTNDDVNQAIREEYGLQTQNERTEFTICKFCGHQNTGTHYECQNCKRPLNLEQAEKQKQMKKAVEIYERIEDEGGIERLQKLERLIDNASKVEQLLD